MIISHRTQHISRPGSQPVLHTAAPEAPLVLQRSHGDGKESRTGAPRARAEAGREQEGGIELAPDTRYPAALWLTPHIWAVTKCVTSDLEAVSSAVWQLWSLHLWEDSVSLRLDPRAPPLVRNKETKPDRHERTCPGHIARK